MRAARSGRNVGHMACGALSERCGLVLRSVGRPSVFDSIDYHPARRSAQIALARAVLRTCAETVIVHQACAVLLALSDDPFDRRLAEELLHMQKD